MLSIGGSWWAGGRVGGWGAPLVDSFALVCCALRWCECAIRTSCMYTRVELPASNFILEAAALVLGFMALVRLQALGLEVLDEGVISRALFEQVVKCGVVSLTMIVAVCDGLERWPQANWLIVQSVIALSKGVKARRFSDNTTISIRLTTLLPHLLGFLGGLLHGRVPFPDPRVDEPVIDLLRSRGQMSVSVHMTMLGFTLALVLLASSV